MVVDGICNEVIQVKRFRLEVVMPRRGTVDVAGFDLTVAEVVIVPAHDTAIVNTGWATAIPRDIYARIAFRSGFAA